MAAEAEYKGRRFGPYTCIRRLGVGGMGEAYLAVRRGGHGFEQRVCIKTIHSAYRASPEFVRLFFQEATIAASLRHSNIVGVIEASDDGGYMVLELVDGVDLKTLVREHPTKRLPPPLVMWVTLELCRALEYAHNRTLRGQPSGIVHRDVSPSNILISYAGEVKLTDFGIAKAMRASAGEASTLRGKIVYMTPEQITGKPVDGRTDLFSAGVTMYELLTGERPFDAENDGATLKRIATGAHVPLAELAPDLPAGLTGVVDRLLSVNPDERFQSATAVIDAVARFSPAPTAYRDLGLLASKARPHVTVMTDDLAELEGLDGSSLALSSTDPAPGSASPPPAARPRAISTPSGGVVATAESVGPATRTAPEARGNSIRFPGGRVTAGLLAAAALGSAAAAGALLFGGETGSPAGVAVGADPVIDGVPAARVGGAAPPAFPARGDTTADPPDPGARSVPTPPTPDPGPSPDPSQGPASAGEMGGLRAPSEDTAAAAKAAAAPARRGTIQVGVFPAGQVWVDGRLRGRAPVTVSVPAGTHTVAAGRDRPAESRTVIVSAGKTEEIVFNVRASQGAPEQ